MGGAEACDVQSIAGPTEQACKRPADNEGLNSRSSIRVSHTYAPARAEDAPPGPDSPNQDEATDSLVFTRAPAASVAWARALVPRQALPGSCNSAPIRAETEHHTGDRFASHLGRGRRAQWRHWNRPTDGDVRVAAASARSVTVALGPISPCRIVEKTLSHSVLEEARPPAPHLGRSPPLLSRTSSDWGLDELCWGASRLGFGSPLSKWSWRLARARFPARVLRRHAWRRPRLPDR